MSGDRPRQRDHQHDVAGMSRREHTAFIFKWLRQVRDDRGINPRARAVVFVVAFEIAEADNHISRESWPSQVGIAERTGLNERSVRRAVDVLDERGHIQVDEKGCGRGRRNHYRLILKTTERGTAESSFSGERGTAESSFSGPQRGTEPTRKADSTDTERRTQRPEKGGHGSPMNHGIDKTRKRKESESTTDALPRAEIETPVDLAFDEFWRAFPSKVDKRDARKEFARVIEAGEATAQELIEGATNYAVACEGQQHIRGPVAWLQKGKWTDEPRQPAALRSTSLLARVPELLPRSAPAGASDED